MIATFCPPRYTGQFATLNHQPDRGYVVTLWQFGKPIRYTPHPKMLDATLEIARGGFGWANETMKRTFEEDVILGGMQ